MCRAYCIFEIDYSHLCLRTDISGNNQCIPLTYRVLANSIFRRQRTTIWLIIFNEIHTCIYFKINAHKCIWLIT